MNSLNIRILQRIYLIFVILYKKKCFKRLAVRKVIKQKIKIENKKQKYLFSFDECL